MDPPGKKYSRYSFLNVSVPASAVACHGPAHDGHGAHGRPACDMQKGQVAAS